MVRLVRTLFVITLFACSVGAQALSDEPECSALGQGKLQLAAEDTTILGISIGTPLSVVEAKLGPAKPLPTHGSASASNTICYSSSDDGTILTFGAGPMGGFTNVTEFALWSREGKFPNAQRCTPSKLISSVLATTSGIRLGLSETDLTSAIGKKPMSQQTAASYEFLCSVKMTTSEMNRMKATFGQSVSEDPYFDDYSYVKVRFAAGRASRIEVYKGDSY